MEEWSISCNTDIDVDFSVFDVWLQGKIESVVFEQVFDNRMKTKWGDAIICSHIHDQFSLFQFLKHYFEHPWNFEVLRYQLDSPTRNRLINAYYSFNYCFARDLLNHRISSKLRKDVDEIADKFRLSELVCLRYFDNFRLVLNKVEDYDKANIVDHIKNTFMMSDELAKSYGTVVFLQNFKIDVSRKKMQFLTFNDLIFLCTNIIANWCSSNNEDGDLLDREFFNRLHECKSIDSEVIGAISDLVLDKSGKLDTKCSSSVDNILYDRVHNFRATSRTEGRFPWNCKRSIQRCNTFERREGAYP